MRILRNPSYQRAASMNRPTRDVGAIQLNGAGINLDQTANRLEQRRLARAIGANDSDELAFAQGEIHSVQSAHLAIARDEPSHDIAQHQHHVTRLRRRGSEMLTSNNAAVTSFRSVGAIPTRSANTTRKV